MAEVQPPLRPAQRQALKAMGIPLWVRREVRQPGPPPLAVPVQAHPTVAPSSTTTTTEPMAEAPKLLPGGWAELEAEARACTRCPLHATRTSVVFGVGDVRARWLVIGEAPGAEEDRQGEPFVGRAGQLLNEMLAAVGLAREQVYIANILKCRPPENRDPKPEEAMSCRSFLDRQIGLLQPHLILAVGRIAAQNLLGEATPIGRLRGHVHRYGPDGIPVIVTYHPAYLLRSPTQKRKAWEDLRLARRLVVPVCR